MPSDPHGTLEVIYNSVCPVCDAGICQFQKKVNPEHGQYVWLDINSDPDRLSAHGVAVDDVRLKLHAIDRTGQLRVGMEAVSAIFAEIPRYKWLAFLTRLPVLKQISALIYNLTAHVLYRWNKSKGRW
jgi:predicted DCC family thiol-disulfide oxidoreductase YuxK